VFVEGECVHEENECVCVDRFLENGPIPTGGQILHTCDNRFCVNPDHLWLGTQLDNIQDMNDKGRCQQGETHYDSKLTPEQVLAIFDDKETSHSELGRRYGVHMTNIMKIRKGLNWKRLLRLEGRISTVQTDQR